MANLRWPEREMFVLAVSRFAVVPRRFAIASSRIIVLPTALIDTASDINLLVKIKVFTTVFSVCKIYKRNKLCIFKYLKAELVLLCHRR